MNPEAGFDCDGDREHGDPCDFGGGAVRWIAALGWQEEGRPTPERLT
jgi:hypothetical protein